MTFDGVLCWMLQQLFFFLFFDWTSRLRLVWMQILFCIMSEKHSCLSSTSGILASAYLSYSDAYQKGKPVTKNDFPVGADVPDAPQLPVKEVRTVPEELRCPLCKEIMESASLIPCCGTSFCDECKLELVGSPCLLGSEHMLAACCTVLHSFFSCVVELIWLSSLLFAIDCSGIRDYLMKNDFVCPECKELTSPDRLSPNASVRKVSFLPRRPSRDMLL